MLDTYAPPVMDMAQAHGTIIPERARTMGRAKPVTTIMEVRNRPKSTPADDSYEVAENSSEPCENIAFGRGARTKVRALNENGFRRGIQAAKSCAPTRSGSHLFQSAQERMISKKPTASTKDKRMTAMTSLQRLPPTQKQLKG